jgi:hypothetical protein
MCGHVGFAAINYPLVHPPVDESPSKNKFWSAFKGEGRFVRVIGG